jgi:hypothetical protein
MMGPVSPVDYRKSPGPNQALMMTRAPQLDSEEQCARIYENIKRYDNENALLETFHLPSLNTLNRLLKTYFDLFHHHLPFLHPATFNPTEVSAPLLLAVLSIGALYIFDQDQAYMLHIGSKVLVNQFLQNKENFSSRKCPLWTMQSTLLNMIFSSWSGDPKGLEWACSIKSLLANVRILTIPCSNPLTCARWSLETDTSSSSVQMPETALSRTTRSGSLTSNAAALTMQCTYSSDC